jgi:hypothetical protein
MHALVRSEASLSRTKTTVLPDRQQQPEHRPTVEAGAFRTIVEQLSREVDRGEAVVHRALNAPVAANDARSMLALQAGVYRYVEAIDLLSRLVDRTASAVKTTLQNQ